MGCRAPEGRSQVTWTHAYLQCDQAHLQQASSRQTYFASSLPLWQKNLSMNACVVPPLSRTYNQAHHGTVLSREKVS